tara:strand:+ start:1272 stop:2165 length:894 start_codon:yes stop_codon:yes gene_type:complete
MKTNSLWGLALFASSTIWLAGCQSTGSIGAMQSAQGYDAKIVANAYMPVGQQVVPPMGFISFCLDDPTQCEGGTDTPTNMVMTPDRWTELNTINDYVNSSVPQVEDISNYGVSERWSYPNANGGDCEDFALLKRKLLIERGWSPADLLIAVVREWNGAGHAILVVDTDRGEVVLDNKNWAIVAWNDTPYTWVKRQSRERPFVWVNLDTRTFRTIANQTVPPLGAPIPFVVAAQTARMPKASVPQLVKAEATPAVTAQTTTASTEKELRPSLIPLLHEAALVESPTATLTAATTLVLR